MFASFSENIARHDLTPTDKAIAVAHLLGRNDLLKDYATPRAGDGKTTYTECELAKCLGVTDTTVDRWLEPLRLQPETWELVEERAVAIKVAEKIRKNAKTPEDEVELAKAFAEAESKPFEKRTIPERDAMELLNQEIPKEELIEKLEKIRDPPYVPPEPEEPEPIPEDWEDYSVVVIDGCRVDDPELLDRINRNAHVHRS